MRTILKTAGLLCKTVGVISNVILVAQVGYYIYRAVNKELSKNATSL